MIEIKKDLGDRVTIKKNKNTVIIESYIDNTGSIFKIDKKKLVNYLLGLYGGEE